MMDQPCFVLPPPASMFSRLPCIRPLTPRPPSTISQSRSSTISPPRNTPRPLSRAPFRSLLAPPLLRWSAPLASTPPTLVRKPGSRFIKYGLNHVGESISPPDSFFNILLYSRSGSGPGSSPSSGPPSGSRPWPRSGWCRLFQQTPLGDRHQLR